MTQGRLLRPLERGEEDDEALYVADRAVPTA
jgi:hypothetical protein